MTASPPAAATPGPSVRSTPPATIHVSPAGSDAADGSAGAPLRTIPAALTRAGTGDVVLLGPGVYPQFRDTQARAGRVTIRGATADRTATVLQGAQLYGSRNLTLEHLAVRAQIDVASHPVRKDAQGSEDLVLRDLDVSSTAAVSCIKVRSNAARIVIRDNDIHDCWAGIGGTGNATVSRDVDVLDNRIVRMTADGMSFGNWHDVRIAGNVITDISDPENLIHNDALQVVGEVSNLVVEDNVLLRSDDQVMILQDVTGPVDDVLFRNNVIAGAGAVAVQTAGLTNTRWIHNTIARSRWSGLWVRGGIRKDASGAVATTPTDTVVVNNVLSGLAFLEGAGAATQAGNVVSDCSPAKTAPSDRCVTDPGFVDAATFDLSLTAASPARAFAVPAWTVARDCAATPRGAAPAAGALEGPMTGCPVSADGPTTTPSGPEPGGETTTPVVPPTPSEPGGAAQAPGPDGAATTPTVPATPSEPDEATTPPAGPVGGASTAPGPVATPPASPVIDSVVAIALDVVVRTPARANAANAKAARAKAAKAKARARAKARAKARARARAKARAKARARARTTARVKVRASARERTSSRARARAPSNA